MYFYFEDYDNNYCYFNMDKILRVTTKILRDIMFSLVIGYTDHTQ